VARSTDGSARVRSAKPASTASVAARRDPNRSRVSTGVATTRAKATFWPESVS
jgi:hypothetical protein